MNEIPVHTSSESGRGITRLGRQYALILFLGILALGTFARFYNLDKFSFWTDELYHVVAAQSVLEIGEPVVPGKGEYHRAYPVTAITAFAFSLFGESEGVARAPFVLINLLFLVVLFIILKSLFSLPIALITMFVLALSPNELRLAREVRMYSLFQLLYVSASFLFFYGLECGQGCDSNAATARPSHQSIRRGSRFLLLTGASTLFLGAAWIQPLAINFAFVIATYSLVMTGYLVLNGDLRGALTSRYALILGVIAAGIGAVWLAQPSSIDYFIEVARERPVWDTHGDSWGYYSWIFLYNYPGFTFVYLLGAALLIKRYGRTGVFVVCSFVPLIVLHTFFFTGRVAERYITYFFPFFIVGAVGLFEPLFEHIKIRLTELWRSGARVMTIWIVLAIVPAAYLYMHPWLSESRAVVEWGMGPKWKEMAGLLQKLSEDHVIMTTWPREVYFYGGRFPDYILTQGYEYNGTGDHELEIGKEKVNVRYIRNSDHIEEQIDASDRLCVVTTDWAYNNPDFLDESMRRVIETRLVPLEHHVDDRILVFKAPR
jgi:4-amino-4-deoxy-L-arabinose transferase-like glycosyltransferase